MDSKRTPASAATLTRAVENGSVCETDQPSAKNDTILAAKRQTFCIADLLLHGEQNAIHRRDLMALTGLPDRALRLKIETERRQGIPILSDCVNGYYLPKSQVERDRCVRSLRRRAAEIEATADAIERTATLEEEGGCLNG